MPIDKTSLHVREEIAAIERLPLHAYETRDAGIRLDANENRFGASPCVKAAIVADILAHDLGTYPPIEATPLNARLADLHGLDSEWVASGAGGETLLPLALSPFVRAGEEVAYFGDGFMKFRSYIQMAGARPVPVSRDGDAVSNMLGAITDKTRVVMFDNPGNPTGQLLLLQEIHRLHRALPKNIMLLMDEAYIEFACPSEIGIALVKEATNVMVLRTLSKAYGLAGLRVGWAAGHPALIGPLKRVLPTFPITRPSLVGAIAALADHHHLAMVVGKVRAIRDATAIALRASGWDIPTSHGNFLLLTSDATERVLGAHAALARRGIHVRYMSEFKGKPAFRLTIGTEDEMSEVIAALRGDDISPLKL
ncbi:pyridoxal phosphate-dependent aminotransferase [Rhizobium sp. G187]|uniref:pyridoxal phosphate-dependent aminotransferase n=1 Tax=Rhizobium sp. G187 TaxID=3451352 RepID=UPI003EE7FD5D